MKLRPPGYRHLPIGLGHWRTPRVSAALCLRPQKKPASLAGFLHLTPKTSRRAALFLPPCLLFRSPRSPQLLIQTPSSF
jgi:hypothetical protein